MSVQPFSISVSPFVIEDLRERLGRARWPDEIRDSGWQYGTNLTYLRDLCTHWGHGFDWKEQEDALNGFHHYRAAVDGLGIHFIHERGKSHHTVPLLLIHGWPDSFVRFLPLIPMLTAEGPDGLSFDVVVVSIPGFGFSDRPSKPGLNVEMVGYLLARLMKEKLGYSRFICHGGDWGSGISLQIARLFPERLLGVHLTDVPAWAMIDPNGLSGLSTAEKEYVEASRRWYMTEGAYAAVQSTKPQTLSYAMNDSPIGLAAWIIEKFYAWTDHPADLEKTLTRDQLLTNLTIYWVTQTAGSSFRLYYENMIHPSSRAVGRIEVPAAVCIAPKDLVPAPREFADRILDVRQWTRLPEGGHFLTMEQPRLLADDLFSFAASLESAGVLFGLEPAIPDRS
ncbi:MAG TPA: epoxide hydrolase [Puia sp.]|jgi:pimeloyl-ACP methyl ester carboxylesterase|nr:epoxide hydrolase [Puia sp.]